MKGLKYVVSTTIALTAFVVLLLSCHKNGVTQGNFDSIASGIQTTGQVGANGAFIEPQFSSSKGMELYLIGDSGKLTAGANGTLSVRETKLPDESIQWEVVDNLGNPRPVYFRIAFSDTEYTTTELYRGEWGANGEAVFAPFFTPGNDIDVGISPIKLHEWKYDDCNGKTIARVVFEKDTNRDILRALIEGTGDDNNAKEKHNYFPFWNPVSHELGYWGGLDNFVEVYAPNTEFDRNKVAIAWNFIDEYLGYPARQYILSETFSQGIATGIKVSFSAVLHGDYDQNGEVNVADITAIAQNYGDVSNYDALTAKDDSNHNPFRGGVTLNDPANIIDGSMNGWVEAKECESPDSQTPDEQRMRNAMSEGAVAVGTEQYTSDISPIAVHYLDELSTYTVLIRDVNDPYNKDKQWTQKERYPKPLAATGYPMHYNTQFYYCTDSTKGGITDGTYTIEIYPTNNECLKTILPLTVTGYPGEEDDTTPPVWVTNPPNQPGGITDAKPWEGTTEGPQFRSVWIQRNRAADLNGIKGYQAYIRKYQQGDTRSASFIVNNKDFDIAIEADPSAIGTTTQTIIHLEDIPQEYRYLWVPGAEVGIAVVATDNSTAHNATNLNNTLCKYTEVSYDATPPEWINTRTDSAVEHPRDIIRWVYGSSASSTGFMIYWDWAKDLDTGISDYRMYYTTTTPAGASGEEFTETQLTTLRNGNSYISAKDFDLSVPFEQLQMLKRFFFYETISPSNNLYVCVRAVNGEGDESTNLHAYNLSTVTETSRFGITVLSEDLNEDGMSGDMAYEGWYTGLPHNLFIANSNKYVRDDETVENIPCWSVNLDGWSYEEGGDPLNPDNWEELNPDNEWYLGKPWLDASNRDPMTGLANGSEISAEYVNGSERVAFGALGDVLNEGTANEELHGYIYSIPAEDGIQSPSNQGVTEHSYVLDPETGIMNMPVDLTPSYIGYSHAWPEMETPSGEQRHTACVAEPSSSNQFYFLPYNWGSYQMQQYDYQIRNDMTSSQGKIMESAVQLNGLPYCMQLPLSMPYAFTLWGRNPTDQLGANLFLYWHVFREDIFNSGGTPVINNRLWRQSPRISSEWSWNYGRCLKYDFSQSTGSIGAPASITMRDENGTQTAYVVYNYMDVAPPSQNRQGIGLLVTTGPTSVTNNMSVSNFPLLINNAVGGGTYYDVLDCGNGTSLNEQRRNAVCSILDVYGSWTPLEQRDNSNYAFSNVIPVDIAFIQSTWVTGVGGSGGVGYELYYGQIYYTIVNDNPVTMCLIERVDSADISLRQELETDDYQPLWCSLGKAFISVGRADVDYEVPVIAYGVKTDTAAGQLRVASIPSTDYVAAPPDPHFDFSHFYIYNSNPNGGVYSQGITPQYELE